ncbi:MAG: glycerophosphodiester phosphodiesterase [Acidobacteriota bacterium]
MGRLTATVLHQFFASPRPLVFAHRGGSALAPENTLTAFANGLALGADGLELDVHLSRDGIVVVHHDDALDRTTNLQGPVAERTAAELGRADAGFRFGAAAGFPFRGRGINVPTLTDVLHHYRDVRIIVELKGHRVALARATVDAVRAAGAIDRVCLGAFGTGLLRAARAAEPALATSASGSEVRWALYRSWCRLPMPRARYTGYQIPEWAGRTRVVTPRFIKAAHRAGLGVQVWTVDEPADARRLLASGADALITDRPDLMVPLVRGIRLQPD